MRIYYVTTGTTGDERAIADAFKWQGHEVKLAYDKVYDPAYASKWDLIFFNHTQNLDKLRACSPPKVGWCFDLVEHDTFKPEWMQWRKPWADKITDIADLMFFTDGDYVQRVSKPNVHWLTQGAQEVGNPFLYTEQKRYDILFAGTVADQRKEFIDDLNREFPGKVKVVQGKERVFGQDFSKLIAQSKIIIAPDVPIKPKYWSNRVWMVLGYGGFLLHPYVESLSSLFRDLEHLVYYENRDQLYKMIYYYLDNTDKRNKISDNGMAEVAKRHMYSHRVAKILNMIKDVAYNKRVEALNELAKQAQDLDMGY